MLKRRRTTQALASAELAVLTDPELLAALAFARARPDPITAAELAEVTGVHRNVAAARLERLAAGGHVAVSHERRSGRSGPGAGRPAKVYTVLPELAALEFPPRRYELLLGHLLDALPARGRVRRLRHAGVEYGRGLAAAAALAPAASVREGLERLCLALGALGFQASLVEASEERAVVVTPTCPLRPLVLARPDAAEIDRGMWTGLVAAAVRGVDVTDVRCDTADCRDGHAACRVLLDLRVRDRTEGKGSCSDAG